MSFGHHVKKAMEQKQMAEPKAKTVTISEEEYQALMERATQPAPPAVTSLDALGAAIAKGIADAEEKLHPHEKTVNQVERKSSFNPLGDRDHPRPKLKCPMFFGSAPLEAQTMTREEIEAVNALEPGFYRITKMDRSAVVFEVRGQMNAMRQVERLWLLPPHEDETANLYPPLDELAKQCCVANRVEAAA